MKLTTKLTIVPIVLSSLLFSSCASIVSKSSYPVTISSNTPGVNVVVTDVKSGGTVHSGQAPTTATLDSSSGFFRKANYNIKAYKGSNLIASKNLKSTVDGWVFGNILIGGIIGLVIDGASGSMYALPATVSVGLKQTDLNILSYDGLTEEEKAQLIKL